jgi:hypothetical protein
MSRPLAWKNVWPVKNLIELKNAQNVIISDNILENNWKSAQNGYGVLFTVRTCEAGNYPWAVVKNVAFTYNIIRNSDQGVNILGTDNDRYGCPAPSVAGLTSNILIQNNLFESLGLNVEGNFVQLLSGARAITVDHNTAIQGGNIVSADGTPSSGFVFTNNMTNFGNYGVVGTGTLGVFKSLGKYAPGYVYDKNVAIAPVSGRVTGYYPADNFFPFSPEAADLAPDFQLGAMSPYKNAARDGKDIGADIVGILNATATVVAGRQTANCNSANSCSGN